MQSEANRTHSTTTTKFFVRRGQRVRGPLLKEEVLARIQTGRLKKTDCIATRAVGPWRRLYEVPQLTRAFENSETACGEVQQPSLNSSTAQSANSAGESSVRPRGIWGIVVCVVVTILIASQVPVLATFVQLLGLLIACIGIFAAGFPFSPIGIIIIVVGFFKMLFDESTPITKCCLDGIGAVLTAVVGGLILAFLGSLLIVISSRVGSIPVFN